jgi:hypothetical protein
MKKVFFGLIILVAMSFGFNESNAQTAPAANNTSAQVAKTSKKHHKAVKKAAEKTSAQSAKAVKTTKNAAAATNKAAAKTAKAAKTTSEKAKESSKKAVKTASAKVDATGHHLKKDGTKDMRYKENKK